MVIIDGPQGQHKSQVLEALGGEFYASPTINESSTGDKEMKMLMRSGWIVEWQEINIFNTKSASEVKRTLSTSKDIFRAPYGRAVKTYPRRFTLWATINGDIDGKILTDPTGNRRFLPVTAQCGKGKGNLIWMVRNRDQIWAEALAIYKLGVNNGGHWWFKTEGEADLAEAVQRSRTTHDEWTDAIAAYVQNKELNRKGSTIWLDDLYEHVLHVPIKDRRRGASVRISKVMDTLGYEYQRRYRGGVKATGYVNKMFEVNRRREEREEAEAAAESEAIEQLDEVDALE